MRQAKFGRDLPDPVHALEHPDSRADPAVPELEEELVRRECGIRAPSKPDAFAYNAQMPESAGTDTRRWARVFSSQLHTIDGILPVLSAFSDHRLHFDGITVQVADDFCALAGNALQVVPVTIKQVG